jgi:2-oxoglutarate dehydrogenase E2 component (dihydrolipoamide succinyltransferase)
MLGSESSATNHFSRVSTDKVDSEMPSPFAGVLTQQVAAEGDTVNVGATVAVIDESATATATASATTPAAAPAPTANVAAPASNAASSSSNAAPSGVATSPVVRRLLVDGGVEASTLRGSGPGGSITRRDAERAVAQGPTETVERPLSTGRRRMAEHMVLSAQSTPHGFVAVEIDGAVAEEVIASGGITREGVPFSIDTVVTLAAVRALSEFSMLNSTFDDAGTVFEHRTINVAVAQSPGDDGMIAPVVHAARELTLRDLAQRLNDLRERTATRSLTTDDLLGGTFTVLPAPTGDTLVSTPLIIQPQSAVLSVGAARRVPVVSDDGSLAVGWRIILGLSFDHRVTEPFTAARFLSRVGEVLQSLDVAGEI